MMIWLKKQGTKNFYKKTILIKTKKTSIDVFFVFEYEGYSLKASHPRAFKAIFVLARVTK